MKEFTLKEVAGRLDTAGLSWAVFAGAAATLYGSGRPVTDVDILVRCEDGEQVANLFPEGQVRREGERVTGVVLPGFDVLAGLEQMDLDAAMEARLARLALAGVDVPVIPLEDNILLKAMWGRSEEVGKHDWQDVEAMLAHGPPLDWNYLSWRAASLAPPAAVQQVLERLEELGRRRPGSMR